MKKNTKILIVIFAALALAAAAAFLIFKVLSPSRTTVYIFNDSYAAGTTVTSNMLTPVQVDSNAVVLGAKKDMNTYFVTNQTEYAELMKSGDTLKIDVSKGMPFMKSMLSVAGGSAIEMLMKPSSIAVTVGVNNIKGITNDLKPGAHVNVYFTSALETKLLFENMRVLGTEKNSNGALTSVSLEATTNQAVVLVNAAESGSIYLGLVNANGYQYITTGNASANTTPVPTSESQSASIIDQAQTTPQTGLTIDEILNGENPDDNGNN